MNPLLLIPGRFQLLAKVIAGAVLMLAMWYAWNQFTGHYIDIGRDEVQTKWDKEKAKQAEAAALQRAENSQKEGEAAGTQIITMAEHQAELKLLRRQNDAKLQSSLADTDAVWRGRLRDAVAADRSRTVSELSSSAQGLAEVWRDGNATVTRQQYDTLEAACKLTTLDYNALRKSWDDACGVFICK